MSVISSRVSSVSSILRSSGGKAQFVNRKSRVTFKLPNNIKDVIFNFESVGGKKEYNDLICLLKECQIEDKDLLEFLTNVRECVPLLGANHQMLIEAILQIRWTNRSKEAAVAYKTFLEDLICMQIYHIKCIIDNLVDQFKPSINDKVKWADSKCKEDDLVKLNHIHDVLHKVLKAVPMSKQLLLHSVRSKFPYMTLGAHMYEVYICMLLQILDYAPELRSEILCLIISRLMILDVNIPQPNNKNEKEEEEEEEESDSDCEGEMKDIDHTEVTNNNNTNDVTRTEPITDTLDTCMEQIFTYLHDCCYLKGTLNIESLKNLYFDILKTFETIILPTHAIQYVQYVIFYISSFKIIVLEAFIEWLWRKTLDPNVPSIIRQSAVCYIGSLLATAAYIPPRIIKTVMSRISKWIHNYICSRENIEQDHGDHWVFYTVCQSLFLIVIFRHKDFINSKEDLLFLHQLNLDKMITCKLNPLRVCKTHIIQSFADVTKTYQLAYCYTIIENNSRNTLPVVQNTHHENWDPVFPFGTYKLKLSGVKIIPLIYNCAIINVKEKLNEDIMDENIEFMTE